MTEKRFKFKRECEDEIDGICHNYILNDDGKVVTDLTTREDCKQCCDLLNEQHETIQSLRLELDTHKHPLWSTREAEKKVSELTGLLEEEVKKNGVLLEENNSLRIENMRLKEGYK